MIKNGRQPNRLIYFIRDTYRGDRSRTATLNLYGYCAGESGSERCLFARRAGGESQGKTDSEADEVCVGESGSERCLSARRAILWNRTIRY